MSKYLFFILCFSLLKGEICSQIVNLDSLRFQRMIIGDTNSLYSLLDDSLLYIHSNGLVESKQSFIHSIANRKIVYQKFEFLTRQKTIMSRNAIAYRGMVMVEGLFEQQPFRIRLAFSSMYRRKGNQFRLYYWQSTKLKD
jgi:hypothetical protein